MRINLLVIGPLICWALLLGACAADRPAGPSAAPSATTTFGADAQPTLPVRPTVAPRPTLAPLATAEPLPPSPLVYERTAGTIFGLDEAGAPVRLGQIPAALDSFNLAVAPDGDAVAYIDAGRAFYVDMRTGVVFDITPPELDMLPGGAPITGFRWSPDGRRVLYDLETGDFTAEPQPVIVEAGRGVAARILGPGLGPAWSPDGTAIAYAGPPFIGSPPFGGGPGGRLTVAGPALEEPRALDLAAEIYPLFQPILWSPEGGRVAAGTTVLDVATGRIERIIAPARGEYLGAILSLRGPGEPLGLWRNIREADPADPGGFMARHVFVSVAPDGAETVLVSTPPSLCPCLPTARPDSAWSSDGVILVVMGEIEGGAQGGLWVVTANGEAPVALAAPVGGELYGPIIAPDGRSLLATEGRDGAARAWVIPLDGGAPREIGEGWGVGWQRPVSTVGNR